MMKQKGFGLIELLVSLTIILILVTGIAELLAYSLCAKRKADSHLKVLNLITAKLELLKTYPFESDELKEGDSSEILAEENSKEIFHRETKLRDIAPDLKKAEVSIFSETRPGQKAELVLYLCRELGF